jgi:hypothetical protein
MNPEFISRIVGLVQKTGDRVILADQQTGKAVVVLDLESYERLCAPSPAQVATPAPRPEIKVQETEKVAEISQNSDAKRKAVFAPSASKETGAMADLTQEELMAKINRDIGAWKTAQDRKRPSRNAFEEEERFYLEPIE